MSAPASPVLAAPIRVAAGTTAGAAVRDAGLPNRGAHDAIVVVRDPDGRLRDLAWTPEADAEVTPVAANTDDGRAVIRHSAAHVLAQAVQQQFPDAKLGIGPPVRDGFYYDFDTDRPFTPEDLQALEKRMNQIIKGAQRFSRRIVDSIDAAKQELSEIEAEEDGKQRRLAIKKDEKTTETEIKQKVKTSKPVTDAVSTMLSLNEQVGKVSALKEAYSKRSYSLSNMVDLHIRMYMGEATTNRTEANVRDAKASSARAQLSQRRRNQEEE